MTDNKISFQDFKKLLSELFGQPLNENAEEFARDFWQNIAAIADGVSQGSIGIRVDMLTLGHSLPEYGSYHVWKGAGTLIFLIALPIFIFSWKIAIGFLFGGIVLRSISNIVRGNAGRRLFLILGLQLYPAI